MIYSKSRRTWLKHYNHLYLQRQRKKTTIPPIPKPTGISFMEINKDFIVGA